MATTNPDPLLQRLSPSMRVLLAMFLLGWLLLQVILLMVANLPATGDVARASTLLIAAGAPLTAWLLVARFPDADVPPDSLKYLLMIAALGFAAATALRWVLRSPATGT